jgi:hypothetical protein
MPPMSLSCPLPSYDEEDPSGLFDLELSAQILVQVDWFLHQRTRWWASRAPAPLLVRRNPCRYTYNYLFYALTWAQVLCTTN